MLSSVARTSRALCAARDPRHDARARLSPMRRANRERVRLRPLFGTDEAMLESPRSNDCILSRSTALRPESIAYRCATGAAMEADSGQKLQELR